MEITFVASQAINDVYHAMQGDTIVGMVLKEGKRWKAIIYRNSGDDYEASFTQRHGAEAFVRNNVAVEV